MTTLSRKCIATNEVKPVSEMVRIVKTKDNKFLIDSDHSGRGAYVSRNIEAIENVKKKRLLNKAFKTQVPLEVYKELEELIKEV